MYFLDHANFQVVIYWLYYLNNCKLTRLSVSFQIDINTIDYYNNNPKSPQYLCTIHTI